MRENSNLENQKICPSCHQLNKRENNYCSYCGVSLEGVESKKVEEVQIPATSEINKQEITETLTGSKYGKLGGWLSCFVLLGVILIAIFFGLSNAEPSSEEEKVGMALGAAACLVLAIGCVIPSILCLTGSTLHYYRGAGNPRKFSISDKEIKIMIPDKPSFQIQWSEIVTVQIYQSESWRDSREFGSHRSNPFSYPIFFILNFYTTTGLSYNFGIEAGLDFRKSTARRIISLIEKYANRLHKEYIWGKNIQKIRERKRRQQSKS
ncbi:MAG: hypothetical protein ACFE9T_15445 [Promethearchaeota archaeon]